MSEPKLTDEQAAELVAAVKDRQTWTPSGMHVNYGESEDRMRGFNVGYDAYNAGDGPENRDVSAAPDDEPFRSAYLDGWVEGFVFSRRLDEEIVVLDPAEARAVAVLLAAVGPFVEDHVVEDVRETLARGGDDGWCYEASTINALASALADPALRSLAARLAGAGEEGTG